MSIPRTKGPFSVDNEVLLLEAIKTEAELIGWTVISASTDPPGTYWFESSGSDGLHHIVGGFDPDTSLRQIKGLVGVDIDKYSIVKLETCGYTNNDSVSPTSSVKSETGTSTSFDFCPRDNLTQYRYLLCVNEDAISVLLSFTSGGLPAQGILYLGIPEPVSGRQLHKQARARISQVKPGSLSSQKQIVLDRNINAALKDGTSHPSDPHTQYLQFQSVISGSAEADDFCQVERIPIISGTLGLSFDNRTLFEIDVQSGVKLARLGGRYDNDRGANDIVSLSSEPNMVICAATNNANPAWSNNRNNCLTAWDAYGGQNSGLDIRITNQKTEDEAEHDPDPRTNRLPYYRLYALIDTKETSLVVQTDNQGFKNVGALKNILLTPFQGQSDLSYFKINNDVSLIYRGQNFLAGGGQGITSPWAIWFNSPGGSNTNYVIGPGWII